MKNLLQTLVRRLDIVSPSCKEATRLQSEALDHRLTLVQGLSLRVHLVLCQWCRRYGRQIKLLRAVSGDHLHQDQCAPGQGLSNEARQRIKRRLQSEKP